MVAGAGCGGSGEASDTVVVTETVAAADDDGAPATGGEDSGGAAPAPQVLSGSGQRMKSIGIARDTPLVVTGTHSGSSNFIVDIAGGDYLLSVKAGGDLSLRFTPQGLLGTPVAGGARKPRQWRRCPSSVPDPAACA